MSMTDRYVCNYVHIMYDVYLPNKPSHVCHIYNISKDCDKILPAYSTYLSLRAKCSAIHTFEFMGLRWIIRASTKTK